MKNKSIRFKLTLWFSVVIIILVGLTFAAMLLASNMVLRGTIRNYLIGTVEQNVSNIQYVEEIGDRGANNFIAFGSGYLQIDLDFMDVINDVHTALYKSDGDMIYGENPLAKQTNEIAFSESRTWNMDISGVRYELYDRKLNLNLPGGEELWVRGIVPETESATQLREIAKISLIILPALIILSVISGYLLSDRLLSPIRKIEKTAEEITKGDDLKNRIDIGRNNDEIGRLATIFNNMFDRLERSFESERRFTSDVSHELRTPTSVILAQTDYILEKERNTDEYIEALEVIKKQGGRMDELISDMLDYTRIEQGTDRYPFDTVDLSAIVNETAEQMSILKTKGISIQSDIAPDIKIKGNSLLLSRLVQNLIDNAYRYGKENGITEVNLKKMKNEEEIVLEVKDNGIGITDEDKEKIFDRFYRGDKSRSEKGTGLGLSMVKRIAQLHGSDVIVESVEGEGSNFKIFFKK